MCLKQGFGTESSRGTDMATVVFIGNVTIVGRTSHYEDQLAGRVVACISHAR